MNDFEEKDGRLPLESEGEMPLRGSAGALIPLIVVPLCIALGLLLHRGPKPLLETAPETDFSAGRAVNHVERLAQAPRPIGSPEHLRASEYLMDALAELGLEPELHEATAVSNRHWPRVSAATVRNVLTRSKGTASTGAVLLVAHYDSVPNAPGASDNALGVATLLETARALLKGPSLSNDVIFLFTDAEEVGLLGARVFAQRHPWAADVALAMNFDGRGSRGPAYLYETSANNGWLIREVARGAPPVIASSLMFEVSKRMPNSTDLTVLKEHFDMALNFAFIDGAMRYHSALDTPEHMSQRTLQHMGSCALSLTQHFGDLNLRAPNEPDAIYFNPAGTLLVQYPGVWAVPSALLLLFVFWVVVELARVRGNASLLGIAFGAVVFAVAAGAAIAAAHYGALELLARHQLFAHQMSAVYLYALVFLALGIFGVVYAPFAGRAGVLNFTLGAVLWWVVIAFVSAIWLPGGSALYVWAPMSSLLGLLLAALSREPGKTTLVRAAYLSFFALPALLLFPPLIRAFHVAMRMELSAVAMVFTALLVGLLLPLLFVVQSSRRWVLPALCLFTAACIVGTLYVRDGYTAKRPNRDLILYGLNGDSGQAVWATSDAEVDEWTEQFFQGGWERSDVRGYFPWIGEPLIKASAPAAALKGPSLEVLSDGVVEGERWLHLRIRSSRQAPILSLHATGSTRVFLADIRGNVVSADGTVAGPSPRAQEPGPKPGSSGAAGAEGWQLRYWGAPPEGIDVWLLVEAGEAATFAVSDHSYGLPEFSDFTVMRRPAHIIPQPGSGIGFSDATVVTRTFSL